MSSPVSKLGENLRRLRSEKGWSQRELAERSGISRPTIANLETGFNGSSGALTSTAEALAEALGVKVGILLESAEESQPAGASK